MYEANLGEDLVRRPTRGGSMGTTTNFPKFSCGSRGKFGISFISRLLFLLRVIIVTRNTNLYQQYQGNIFYYIDHQNLYFRNIK